MFFYKAGQDVDTAKARWRNSSVNPGHQTQKSDSLREELDEAEAKFEIAKVKNIIIFYWIVFNCVWQDIILYIILFSIIGLALLCSLICIWRNCTSFF